MIASAWSRVCLTLPVLPLYIADYADERCHLLLSRYFLLADEQRFSGVWHHDLPFTPSKSKGPLLTLRVVARDCAFGQPGWFER
jgi:hypothetical protein